jgi:hypothetical protein
MYLLQISSGCVEAENLLTKHTVPVSWERRKRELARELSFSR